MANQKHLTALDRITIENGLKNNDSFKAIAKNSIRIVLPFLKRSKRIFLFVKLVHLVVPSITVFTDIHARNVILPVTTVQL